jgi:hypothetical protein
MVHKLYDRRLGIRFPTGAKFIIIISKLSKLNMKIADPGGRAV